ncbi:hypothetical protein AALO_G00018930 [Alosa alosa]|uniref:Uncharacterized protein n=1 Tax=Alosa alosa TaxID=278164 RepID=A0AAV6HHF8_9TELE|nr:hypothetical protein AALO_G00018930 [Alosa alosa]
MDAFEEKMDELLMLLRSSQSPPSAPVDDILLSSCSTVTELQERRNKMPSHQDLYSGTQAGGEHHQRLHISCTHTLELPPLWQALQIPAHKNNQTQEQLFSHCRHSPELQISGVIPTLTIHLHITYFIIPICILHTTFALLLCTLHHTPCVLVLVLCLICIVVLYIVLVSATMYFVLSIVQYVCLFVECIEHLPKSNSLC